MTVYDSFIEPDLIIDSIYQKIKLFMYVLIQAHFIFNFQNAANLAKFKTSNQ